MITKLLTWYLLGFKNIAIVAKYRILKRLGFYRFTLPIKTLSTNHIFSTTMAGSAEKYNVDYFSYHSLEVSSPPNWFLNPWNNSEYSNTAIHWSDIPDFMPDLGDIKLVWELSRFDWLPKMAWKYQQGDDEALSVIELWLRDWVKQNPANAGLNWKCGQEASLRCLNLIVTAMLIDDSFENPSEGFLSLLDIHASRIVPTLRYAMAQDNNHGTSEAAALFVTGEYLLQYGTLEQKRNAKKWVKLGRTWLENRVKRLVMDDGSFAQHSVTYHRLFLDSLSLVELIRKRLDTPSFSESFYVKIKSAVNWLVIMTDRNTGGAVNLGANDGAYLFNLDCNEYRNFQPSIQLSAAVFLEMAYDSNHGMHPLLSLFQLDLSKLPELSKKPSSLLFKQGGYFFLGKDDGFAVMRLPIFKFRPSHADAHHVDIWNNGLNLLRDAGTFSYNTDDSLLRYFSGTESHNTVQFNGRDQMPRLGRFLFGNWLNSTALQKDDISLSSTYIDSYGAEHKRKLTKTNLGWQVTDSIKANFSKAVLRWRLCPDEWELKEKTLIGKYLSLSIETDLDVSLSLTNCYESLYYMDKVHIPVLEVSCHQSGTIHTHITLH